MSDNSITTDQSIEQFKDICSLLAKIQRSTPSPEDTHLQPIGQDQLFTAKDIQQVTSLVLALRERVADTIDVHTSNELFCSLMSGFSSIDEFTGGFRQGSLNVLGARPGVGKTSFALNLISNVLKDESKSVLFLSLQSDPETITLRLCSSLLKVPHNDIYKDLNAVTLEKVQILNQTFSFWGDRFSCNYCSKLHPRQVISFIKTMSFKGKTPDLIVIDYFQLMSLTSDDLSSKVPTNDYDFNIIASQLKSIASAYKLPILLLSQVAGFPDGSDYPKVDMLRAGKGLGEVADLVLFLYEDPFHRESIKVNVAKNRNGPTGDCAYLNYDGSTFTFSEDNKNKEQFPDEIPF